MCAVSSKIRQFSLIDKDRNHLVARFIWLKVLCAYPQIDPSVLHVAVMLHVYMYIYLVSSLLYVVPSL